ncbi:RHS repeat-associated core domain-containing protein [Pseudomonas putida]|uniref:RHS repeat-associated core domain-containing protein n=1 Tax=Pseudomonas putida TaxID=303 RepID=UPI0018E66FDB|nr:RHS repeat-associated core domain-containing protein [Pseudomonas putida]
MSKSGKVNAFHQDGQLVTELGDDVTRSVFRGQEHFLGHLASGDKQTSSVSAVDSSNTVMAEPHSNCLARFSYTPYGQRARSSGFDTPWAYHGERRDARLDGYSLGNGYRLYRPALMRFGAPDNLSPFGQGMLNAYAYCMDDPVNQSDPSGHFAVRSLYKYPGRITTAASSIIGTVLTAVGASKKDDNLLLAGVGVYVVGLSLAGPLSIGGRYLRSRQTASSYRNGWSNSLRGGDDRIVRGRPQRSSADELGDRSSAHVAGRRDNISSSARQSSNVELPPSYSSLFPGSGSAGGRISHSNSNRSESIELQQMNREVRSPDLQ